MQNLSALGRQVVNDLAEQQGFSVEAVLSMSESIKRGGGRMAQFSHPEFGGVGQWMVGGMTMTSDMFNAQLKSRIDRLCVSLSRIMSNSEGFVPREREYGQEQNSPRQDDVGTAVEQQLGGERITRSDTPSVSRDSPRFDGWWPQHLGEPSSTGSQNDMRYAYFPHPRRLLIEINGKTTAYDTGDLQISGVSQQQASDRSLTFTSQYGPVDVTRLPTV
jgi:hypothetical protein